MALTPKTLQLSEGETGTISARVIPEGTPVEWSSDNVSVATVDNGSVTGVSAGDATITAKITVDGMEYTDICNVTIESQWQEVTFFLGYETWNTQENWIRQDYADSNRQTFYSYDSDVGGLRLMYNPDGEQSTLFLDLQPSSTIIALDLDNYEYALYFSDGGCTDDMLSTLVTLTGNENNVFVADGWSNKSIRELYDLTTSDNVALPLLVNNAQGARLFTMQMRINGELQSDSYYLLDNFSLYRRAK